LYITLCLYVRNPCDRLILWISLLIPVRLFAWNNSSPAGQMSAKLPVCYFFFYWDLSTGSRFE